jgi:hypothetical protein
MKSTSSWFSSGGARWLMAVILVFVGCTGGGSNRARPQVQFERVGEPVPPLPEKAKVEIFERGEPNRSYREVGRVTASCPVKHWVAGQQVEGRPVCLRGLRQGARKVGAQVVLGVESQTVRPDWAPGQPWLIMRGVAVKLLP